MSNDSELSVWRCGLHLECVFEKPCPLKWESLKPTENDTVRFCDQCDKNVYEVQSPEDFVERSKNGECVAINMKMGEMEVPNGVLGNPVPWNYATDANVKEWWQKIEQLSNGKLRRQILRDINNMKYYHRVQNESS